MIHYGRPKSSRNGTASAHMHTARSAVQHAVQHTEIQQAAGRVLALGGAMIAGFFLLMAEEPDRPAADSIPADAVAVMSTAVQEKETVILPEKGRDEAAGAEPFGYMDGEWNLWEYIGDLMWSLLS